MTSRRIFGSKNASEIFRVTFAFLLPVGETISSASVSSAVYSGGASTLSNSAASISGAEVISLLSGGTEGVVFLVNCEATTSAGQVLNQEGFLSIVPEGA